MALSHHQRIRRTSKGLLLRVPVKVLWISSSEGGGKSVLRVATDPDPGKGDKSIWCRGLKDKLVPLLLIGFFVVVQH